MHLLLAMFFNDAFFYGALAVIFVVGSCVTALLCYHHSKKMDLLRLKYAVQLRHMQVDSAFEGVSLQPVSTTVHSSSSLSSSAAPQPLVSSKTAVSRSRHPCILLLKPDADIIMDTELFEAKWKGNAPFAVSPSSLPKVDHEYTKECVDQQQVEELKEVICRHFSSSLVHTMASGCRLDTDHKTWHINFYLFAEQAVTHRSFLVDMRVSGQLIDAESPQHKMDQAAVLHVALAAVHADSLAANASEIGQKETEDVVLANFVDLCCHLARTIPL